MKMDETEPCVCVMAVSVVNRVEPSVLLHSYLVTSRHLRVIVLGRQDVHRNCKTSFMLDIFQGN